MMDSWYIWYTLGGVFLGWTIPWTILQISDGMFLMNQIFRIVFWMGFFISYELTELNWVYCLLLAHIPGAVIWSCYDHWFDDGDEFQRIDDDFEIGTSIEYTKKTDTLIVWNIPEPSL